MGREVYKLSITVDVRNGNVEQAMRVLKRKVMKEGLVKELRERQSFEKPSEKKRRKKKENIANVKKNKKKLERTRGY
jgi:small subunit ribosomal protein S21|tara:strand:- start:737 stop:967 length:231 start_codon:yes stop_codon:yes gene_type:complete